MKNPMTYGYNAHGEIAEQDTPKPGQVFQGKDGDEYVLLDPPFSGGLARVQKIIYGYINIGISYAQPEYLQWLPAKSRQYYYECGCPAPSWKEEFHKLSCPKHTPSITSRLPVYPPTQAEVDFADSFQDDIDAAESRGDV